MTKIIDSRPTKAASSVLQHNQINLTEETDKIETMKKIKMK